LSINNIPEVMADAAATLVFSESCAEPVRRRIATEWA
jgi:hypothetical protein